MLALATRAASAGNMQPWRFSYDGRQLGIRLDAGSEPRSLNHAGRVSAMTLGGLLEQLAIAATTEGYDAQISLEPRAAADAAWATVRFGARAGVADPLARAMETRFTDRRDYHGGSILDPVFERIRSDASLHPECRLYLASRALVSPELLRLIIDSERFFWTFKPVQQQVMSVMRWTDEESARTRDGAIWRAFGLSPLVARMFAVYRGWPLQAALNAVGFLRSIEDMTRSAILSAAGMGLITIRASTLAAFVESSRLNMRAWLHLHDGGYAMQPFTSVALYAAEGKEGELPAEWPEEIRQMFTGGMGLLRRMFDFPEDELPVWLFRAGKSPGPPPASHYTYRYDLDRVLTLAP
jgi:hypothetical protein